MPSVRRLIAVGAVLALTGSGIAFAQTAPAQHPVPMDPHAAMHAGTVPTLPGQDAFGTVQEISRYSKPIPRLIGRRSISKLYASISST
jgi:hypothetical protein